MSCATRIPNPEPAPIPRVNFIAVGAQSKKRELIWQAGSQATLCVPKAKHSYLHLQPLLLWHLWVKERPPKSPTHTPNPPGHFGQHRQGSGTQHQMEIPNSLHFQGHTEPGFALRSLLSPSSQPYQLEANTPGFFHQSSRKKFVIGNVRALTS